MYQFAFVIFAIGAIMIIGAVFIYSKKEDNDYSKTLKMISEVKNDLNQTKDLLSKNIETVGNHKLMYETLLIKHKEENKNSLTETCKEIDYKLFELKDECHSIERKYLDLLEKISKKKSSLKMPESINIQIVSDKKKEIPKGKGLESLFKTKNNKKENVNER